MEHLLSSMRPWTKSPVLKKETVRFLKSLSLIYLVIPTPHCILCRVVFWGRFFETGSLCVVQADLKLLDSSLSLLSIQDYRCVPSCPACCCNILSSLSGGAREALHIHSGGWGVLGDSLSLPAG